jgi:hypothetical protein
MKETLITFETAKLAKEKGFSVGTHGCLVHYKTSRTHPEDGNSGPFGWEKGEITSDSSFIINGREDLGDYSNENYDCYELPTQSLLQKWLREEYNCYIDILPHRDGDSKNEKWKTKEDVFWLVEVDYYGKNFEIEYTEESDFSQTFIKTYEEALEIGLQEGLKLIEIVKEKL